MTNNIFSMRKLNTNTYLISGKGCDSYLLTNSQEGIMIDSGMAKEDIRSFAEEICNLPVRKVINTHSHFDHTAGNGFFEVIYATEGISRSFKNTMGKDPSLYRLDYDYTLVNDGDILDFAERKLEVVVLDCHAPGSLCIIDHTNRILFPGDEIECGQVLLLPGYAEKKGQIHAKPAASVETYLKAMKCLKAKADSFDIICPSHNGSPIDKSYLDNYIKLAEMILNGYEGDKDCSSATFNNKANHFPLIGSGYRRAEYKGASLIYQEQLIFDKDYDKANALPIATLLHLICRDYAYEEK